MSIIQHKRSATTGNAPASLLDGELAINEADSLLFFDDNAVVTKKRLIEPRRLIVRGTVTSVASLTLDLTAANVGVMSGFDIYLSELRPATDGVDFLVRVGDVSGIKTGASDYRRTYVSVGPDYTADTWDAGYGTSVSSISVMAANTGNAAGEGLFLYVRLGTNDPAYASNPTKMMMLGFNQSSDSTYNMAQTVGEMMTAITLTQCQFLFSSGNIAECRYALLGVP